MATTTAKNKKQVDEMVPEDRMWDSLGYTYGQRADDINKSFDQARLNADKQAQSRGMQRSSYNNQVLANLDTERAKSIADNDSQKIAEYEKYLTSKEQQDAEADRWERQFAANREDSAWNRQYQQGQFDWQKEQADRNYNYQLGRDSVADNQWNLNFNAGREDSAWSKGMQEKEYNAGREDTAWNKAMQEKQFNANRSDVERNWNFQQQQYRDSRDDTAWNKQFQQRQYADSRADADWNKQFQQRQYSDSRADTAWNRQFQQQQYSDNRADTAWQQALTERQYADNRSDNAWQRAFTEQQYADSRADTAWNQAFQERQWQTQVDQWNKTFDYNSMSDEQKINYNYVTYALQQGADVSDEMLAKAGLSRADYNAMKQQAAASGATGGGGYNPPPTTPPPTGTDKPKTVNDFIADLQKGIVDANRGKANDFSGLKPNINLNNITANESSTGTKAITRSVDNTAADIAKIDSQIRNLQNQLNKVPTSEHAAIKNTIASLESRKASLQKNGLTK